MRRVRLEISDDVDQLLTEFAETHYVSKSEALRRAIGLLALAQQQRRQGQCLAIAKENEDKELQAIGRITGV